MAAPRPAFRLAEKVGRVETQLVFALLRENDTRTGFFERDASEAVCATLPDWLRPVATFRYSTAWRTVETLRLQSAQVDLKAGVIRLGPGTTKNRQGRALPLRALPAHRRPAGRDEAPGAAAAKVTYEPIRRGLRETSDPSVPR